MTPLVEFAPSEAEALALALGIAPDLAQRLRDGLDEALRASYGGQWHYVHGQDLQKRNTALVIRWNAMLRDNAAIQRECRKTVKALGDELCAEFGISRRTRDRILSGDVAESNLPLNRRN